MNIELTEEELLMLTDNLDWSIKEMISEQEIAKAFLLSDKLRKKLIDLKANNIII